MTNGAEARDVAWFHDLDAWTEYWDIYHPETDGKFYFGDGRAEPGLLSAYLPRTEKPPAFQAWVSYALGSAGEQPFADAIREPSVAPAVAEVDGLLARLFAEHFGDASDPATRLAYVDATFRFAIDALPPAPQRLALVPAGDPRQRTAGRHTLDGDLMWFAWAVHLAAADVVAPSLADTQRRALMMAGITCGCPANFAWRGHRRTRSEYRADRHTANVLKHRALAVADDLDAAHQEVRELFRIREWGED